MQIEDLQIKQTQISRTAQTENGVGGVLAFVSFPSRILFMGKIRFVPWRRL